MEDISVANGRQDLTKAQMERLTQPNSTTLRPVGSVHLWLPGCVALGRESITEQVWSCDFPLPEGGATLFATIGFYNTQAWLLGISSKK